nr:uncharacterized protein LOC112920665 [Vulpes vulpes]
MWLHPPLTGLCGYIKLDACLRFLRHISIVNVVSCPCEGAGASFNPALPKLDRHLPSGGGRTPPPTGRPRLPATGPRPRGGHRGPPASSRQSSSWYLCPSPPNSSAPAICTLLTATDVTITARGTVQDSTADVCFPELKELHPDPHAPTPGADPPQPLRRYPPAGRPHPGPADPGPGRLRSSHEASLCFLLCSKFRLLLNKHNAATICPGDCGGGAGAAWAGLRQRRGPDGPGPARTAPALSHPSRAAARPELAPCGARGPTGYAGQGKPAPGPPRLELPPARSRCLSLDGGPTSCLHTRRPTNARWVNSGLEDRAVDRPDQHCPAELSAMTPTFSIYRLS